jgi:hypothetical protein
MGARSKFVRLRLVPNLLGSTKVIHVRAIAFQEGDIWCAQCLEYDIAVQASDIPNLREALEQALVDQIQISLDLGIEPFSNTPRAPQAFHQFYESAVRDNSPKKVKGKNRAEKGAGPVVRPELRLFTGQSQAFAGAAC